jgi:TM2 domain-containing membrane protein YozV
MSKQTRSSADEPRVVHVTNIIQDDRPRWNRAVALLLSLIIPGLGQLYKGQLFSGIFWFIAVAIGYVCFIVPGIILHVICIIGAASGNTRK